MTQSLFPPVNPPVMFLGGPKAGNFYGEGIQVVTTTDLSRVYNEILGEDVSWIPMGTLLGYIKYAENGKINVFHPGKAFLGECQTRFSAVEFLLKLYVAQNKKHQVLSLREESSFDSLAEAV